jgi:hypothetical protein
MLALMQNSGPLERVVPANQPAESTFTSFSV